jgi:hypothetical protein
MTVPKQAAELPALVCEEEETSCNNIKKRSTMVNDENDTIDDDTKKNGYQLLPSNQKLAPEQQVDQTSVEESGEEPSCTA